MVLAYAQAVSSPMKDESTAHRTSRMLNISIRIAYWCKLTQLQLTERQKRSATYPQLETQP